MDNELPIITIGRDRFLLDTANDLLRLEENGDYTIRFADMEDHGTHYSFRYYPKVKNTEQAGPGVPWLDVEIKPLVQIDPEGMSKRYGLSVDQMKGKTDYEIIVNDALVRHRLDGNLPTIDIEGHKFYVDIRMQSLRPHNDFTTEGITLMDLKDFYYPVNDTYSFLYDARKHEVAAIDLETVTEIPKHIVALEIPTFTDMDPVGIARDYSKDFKKYLRAHPPRAELKAQRIPWEDTVIGLYIERNLKKAQEQKPGDEERRQKPRLRP